MYPHQYPPPQHQQHYPQHPHAQMAGPRCEDCGLVAPTMNVKFIQNIGCLVVRFTNTVGGELCRRCCDKHFWSMTLITATLGWWGVISFFMTLIALPINIVSFVRSRSLALGPAPAPVAASPSSSLSLGAKLAIAAATIVVAVAGLIDFLLKNP